MKKLLFVFALLFFAPVPNFAIVSSHKTETVLKKTEWTPKQKKVYTLLAISLGCLGAGLVTASTPILSLICYGLAFIFAIIGLIIQLRKN